MAWEALNNITATDGSAEHRRLVIVVNDNGRSYTPTVGGLANHLTSLRTDPRYEPLLDEVKRRLQGVPGVGPAVYDALHAVKKGMKDALAPQGLFEDLGLKYVGPIDGHDRVAVEHALAQAKRFDGPVLVHAITRKGFGYSAAERHEADQFHSPGPFDVVTGEEAVRGLIWTDVFADEMVRLGHERPDVVGITAAMLHPVGLAPLRAGVPGAGLRRRDRRAARGHVRGRAGDGRDAPRGRGLRDVPQPGVRPGAHGRGAAPLRGHLRPRPGRRHRRRRRRRTTACGTCRSCRSSPASGSPHRATPPGSASSSGRPCEVDDAPTVVRFPKGPPSADLPAIGRVGGGRRPRPRRRPRTCCIVAVGAMATTCVEVADRLAAQGIGVTVVDPRWVRPVDPALVELAREHRLVVNVEDNGIVGGTGAALLQTLNEERVTTPVRLHGVPQRFLDHAKRARILEQVGLTPQTIARSIVEDVTALDRGDRTSSTWTGDLAGRRLMPEPATSTSSTTSPS